MFKSGRLFCWFSGFILVLFSCFSLYAQVPPSQTVGGVQERERQEEKESKIEKRIETKVKPVIEDETAGQPALPQGEKVLITKIVVEGAVLLPKKDIEKITSRFENKSLTLTEMQKVADSITDAYRAKGFATSRAYLPGQTIKSGILTIRVIEGRVGDVSIKGNRFFKTSVLRKKIDLEPRGYFDYSALQRSLVYINESPDRVAKAILVPGKEPGTTDIILDVKDRFPMHAGFEYDNYGSRYIEKNRWSFLFDYNNLFGLDDKISFKLQKSEASLYELKNARYLLPLTRDFEIGAYYSRSDLKLGKEFRPLDARGKATIIGMFVNTALINNENFDLRMTTGFDYKDIRNYLVGLESSRDYLRVVKQGIDLDITDKFGRTIILSELDIGIPDIMGGTAAKSDHSSRPGAGGKFYKGVFNIFRLQPLPKSMALLIKTSGQFSAYNLVASEQFQIGGATSVRGYPPGEFSGDKGWYSSAEWSIPLYFIPRKMNLPFSNEKVYDTFRLVTFYDWATTHLTSVLPGDKKYRTLKAAGFGLRFNLKNYVSARVEIGYPLGRKPSDGNNVHPWFEFTCKF